GTSCRPRSVTPVPSGNVKVTLCAAAGSARPRAAAAKAAAPAQAVTAAIFRRPSVGRPGEPLSDAPEATIADGRWPSREKQKLLDRNRAPIQEFMLSS